MNGNFEWQFDEENGREEHGPLIKLKDQDKRPWGWSFLMLIFVVLALGVAGTMIYRQGQARLSLVEANIEADVIATHKLVQQMAIRVDDELIYSLLSGSDLRWSETQIRLLGEGLFIARPGFGLNQASDQLWSASETDVAEVTLSPDLTVAEVVSEHRYVVIDGLGKQQNVVLKQTNVFRKGESRWLIAPFKKEFWGGWATWEGKWLTMVYPLRDKSVAEMLAVDLNALLDEMCLHLAELNCPPEMQVWLRLDDTLDSLLAANDLESLINRGFRVSLPAPTLVGLPVDEAGYEALYRGYGMNLVSAVISRLVGYRCCQHGLFFRALLDKQKEMLDLQAWPLTEKGYDQILLHPFRWTTVFSHWQDNSLVFRHNWEQVYSLVDFLQEGGISTAALTDLQRGLNQVYDRYLNWANEYVMTDYDINQFTLDWLKFIYQQTSSGRMAEPPIPLPEQDILLSCDTTNGLDEAISRFDPDTNKLEQVFVQKDFFGFITPLSAGGYIIHHRVLGQENINSRLVLWREGEEILISAVENRRDVMYFLNEDPTGKYGIFLSMGNPGEPYNYKLLDLEACAQGECETLGLLNQLSWSPDGSRTLLVEPVSVDGWTQQSIYVGDNQGQSLVGVAQGFAPIWIGNNAIGLVQEVKSSLGGVLEHAILTAVDGDVPGVVLRASDLLDNIPMIRRPDSLYIQSIQANQVNGRLLSVVATNSAGPFPVSGYHFLVRLSDDLSLAEEITLNFQLDKWPISQFSPNGRWLLLFMDKGLGTEVHLFDLETDNQMVIGTNGHWAGWSADGNWLVQRYDDYLTLLAPEYNYQHMIFGDFSECRSTRWVS